MFCFRQSNSFNPKMHPQPIPIAYTDKLKLEDQLIKLRGSGNFEIDEVCCLTYAGQIVFGSILIDVM